MWLHLDDEVLSLVVTAVAVALPDPARRVDLPEAAQADAAPDAPLNAPETRFSDETERLSKISESIQMGESTRWRLKQNTYS